MTPEIDQKALEAARREFYGVRSSSNPATYDPLLRAAIAAYLAATTSNAAETAKPVAWRWRWGKMGNIAWRLSVEHPTSFAEEGYVVEPLYAAPQPLSTSSGEDRAAVVEDAVVVACNVLEKRARYFVETKGHMDREDIARSYLATRPEIAAAIRKLSEKPE